jgi:hypothetical protein
LGSAPSTPPESAITSIALIAPDQSVIDERQRADDIRSRHLRKASEVDLFKLSELMQQPVMLSLPPTGNRRPSANQRPTNLSAIPQSPPTPMVVVDDSNYDPLQPNNESNAIVHTTITITTPEHTTSTTNGNMSHTKSSNGSGTSGQHLNEHRHTDRTTSSNSNGHNNSNGSNSNSSTINNSKVLATRSQALAEPLLSSSDPDPYSSQYATQHTGGRPSSPSSVTFAQLPMAIRILRVSYILLAIMVFVSALAYTGVAVTDHSSSNTFCSAINTAQACGDAFPRCVGELHSSTSFVCLANDQVNSTSLCFDIVLVGC